MGFDFVVIGATGQQGRIVSRDLLEKGYSVLLCGRDKSRVVDLLRHKKANFAYLDLRDDKSTFDAIKRSGSDVVINCAEGDWNLDVLRACIKAKAHSIDLGSKIDMTKKQLDYDSVLKKNNLIHITGAGSIPGICNVMLAHAVHRLDSLSDIETGFAWDSNIKKFVVPFSIESVIEEVTEPAPIIKNGKIVNINPMSSVCRLNRFGIGPQNCFLIHHAEVYTFYRYFKDMGLKNVKAYAGFPKHSFEKIQTMIDLGLGSLKEMEINGAKIRPVEFLTQVLKKLKVPKGYTEKENLWLDVSGKKDGKEIKISMECLVVPLKGWEESGCNIDTGLPASIIAQMIKNETIVERGAFAPEGVVPPKLFFAELRKKGMKVFENGKVIN